MSFVPEQNNDVQVVPYFDDAQSKDGWQGQATQKSVDKLKQEVTEALIRLGATVTDFQPGTYSIEGKNRDGFRISYVTTGPKPELLQKGRLDIAALPVKDHWRVQKTVKKRRKQSLKMALYMARIGLTGTWFLGKLSPGYVPLVPWMIVGDTNKTITELWKESSMGLLLTSGKNEEFIEGEMVEV